MLIHAQVNWPYIAFVFTSTLALYNFPVFVERNFLPERSLRHRWISGNKKLLMALFVFSAIATGIIVLFFPLKFTLFFIPVALLAFAYFFPQTQLRRIAGLKSAVVAIVWTCVTAIFPIIFMCDFDSRACLTEMNGIILLQNFLFIFPLCLIFNVRDIAADRKAGVRTLPVLYGEKITIAVCLISLALFSLVVALYPSLREGRSGLLFCAAATGVLMLFASKNRSDYYYSLGIDGMILLQAGITLLKISP